MTNTSCVSRACRVCIVEWLKRRPVIESVRESDLAHDTIVAFIRAYPEHRPRGDTAKSDGLLQTIAEAAGFDDVDSMLSRNSFLPDSSWYLYLALRDAEALQ